MAISTAYKKGYRRVDIYNDLFIPLDVDETSNLHSITHSLARATA